MDFRVSYRIVSLCAACLDVGAYSSGLSISGCVAEAVLLRNTRWYCTGLELFLRADERRRIDHRLLAEPFPGGRAVGRAGGLEREGEDSWPHDFKSALEELPR